MSDPIERLRRKAQNEATALALNEALHLAETEIKRLCAERAVARSRAEYWKAEHLACNAENEKLRAAGVGYSQQTVDALSSERDRLRAERDALKADAERYRWLRGDSCPDHSSRWTQWEVRCWKAPSWTGDLRRADLDDAIDAARGIT